MSVGSRLRAIGLLTGMTLVGLDPALAFEIERNFAGSAQLDQLLIPTAQSPRDLTFDGFTTELALKLTVDFTENISANVKVCYGCHGFEADMAYADVRVSDELNFRLGRINAAFGDFPLRHDPANHRANSKPLPYDMGRMLRLREWNMGVLPVPYSDNGLEVNGTRWIGDDVQFDYAVYLVGGFKGTDNGLDLDFIQSRSGSFYYVDNNAEPVIGGRTSLSVNLSDDVSASLGFSGMWGHYDPSAEQEYFIGGADLYLRINELVFRAEYLIRRTEFSVVGNIDSRFRYQFDPKNNFFIKDGFYVEAEYPISDQLEVFGRFDGLRRNGNVALSSPLRSKSAILRSTLGLNYVLARGMRLKLSGEFWDFSDFSDEIAVHTGVVANF